jgi:RimJ/RimL family protein N-acetyltransferase
MIVAIRRLGPSDAEVYVAIRREMLADAPFAFLASPESDVGSDPEKVRPRLSAGPENATFGAFDPVLVGVVGMFREPHAKAAHKMHIWGMYVTGARRRRGIARRLMQTAIAHARTIEGIRHVSLSVSATASEARALYESLGFRAWGTEPDALRYDGRFADEIHMSLVLADVPAPEGGR